MSYLFTSESVSEGHPDKVADQITDAIIDNFLAFDKDSKVAKLHLEKLGLEFEELTADQANYIGVKREGPFKPSCYRY
jgi:S-adenosylmethionine synthetase